MNMRFVTAITAALCVSCGCASPRTVIERQTRAVGERAESAVAAKFSDIPHDSLRWAEVFWYCTRSSETSSPAIGPTATVEVLDVRTLKEDSYSFPKVKRFRVEMDADHRPISVERDTDGILGTASERGPSNNTSEDIRRPADGPSKSSR